MAFLNLFLHAIFLISCISTIESKNESMTGIQRKLGLFDYGNSPNIIIRRKEEIRSKAKAFLFEAIQYNYMYISLLCSSFLLVLFLFLISCVWHYWHFFVPFNRI